MSKPIPVNPEVLRWARVSLSMGIEEVAQKLQRRVEEIEAWERGDASPTYVQLEKLAYEVYKRPMALFFFPEPPDEEDIGKSFRTLPEIELQRLSPRIRYLLRKAKVLQMNLAELFDGVNPAQRNILRDTTFEPTIKAATMAERVREYLGVDLARQQSWNDAEEALQFWRDAIEEHGIFIFKDSFNKPGRGDPQAIESSFSGFCLYDVAFPLIYVNNNKPTTRQIFTLFHELAHLLLKTGGVDTAEDSYVNALTGNSKRIEVLCNEFAGEFLVPSADLKARVAGMRINDQSVSDLAHLYCVSREVILRRFLDDERVTAHYYEQKVQQYRTEGNSKKGGGGDHYLTKGAYLGERYIEKVFSHYQSNRITTEQTADYLGESVKNVPGMEAWLFKHEGAR